MEIKSLIKENVAPYNAKYIGVYDENDKKIGCIKLPERMSYNKGKRLYRFGILSDVHFRGSNDTTSEESEYSTEAESDFNNAISFFNSKETIDFTCIAGDIGIREKSDWERFKENLSKNSPQTPIFICKGNHDTQDFISLDDWWSYITENNPYDGITKYEPTGSDEEIPSFYFTKNNGKDIFIFFSLCNGINYETAGTTEYPHIKWLHSILEENRNNRCFVFIHLPFYNKAGNMYPNGEENYNIDYLLENRANATSDTDKQYNTEYKCLNALNNYYTNSIWFNGHTHYKWLYQEYFSRENVSNDDPSTNEESAYNIHIPSCAYPRYIKDVAANNPSNRGDDWKWSEGGVVDVYEKYIEVRGITFKNGKNAYDEEGNVDTSVYINKYMPLAYYKIPTNKSIVEANPNIIINILKTNDKTYATFSDGVTREYNIVGTLTSSSAPFNASGVTKVEIGTSVTGIGSKAFSECTLLTSVTLSDNITKISGSAFEGCIRLAKINIPSSVTSIGEKAFKDCKMLTSITMPNVTYVANYAFENCAKLNTIILPGTVSYFGDYVFPSCLSLGTIKIINLNYTLDLSYLYSQFNKVWVQKIIDTIQPNGKIIFSEVSAEYLKEDIVDGTYAHWEGNTLVAGAESNGYYYYNYYNEEIDTTKTIIYYASEKLSTTVDNTTSGLHTNAFNSNIGTHTFENGKGVIVFNGIITKVNAYAFYGCQNLTSIVLPDKITSIGENVFTYCINLSAITIPATVTSIGNAAFASCNSLSTVDLPNGINIISNSLFSNCNNLTAITIPTNVTSINEYAFDYCNNLININIPINTTSIGYNAFSNCSKLSSITIPNSVTSIGYEAFSRCTSLTSITIPSSLTIIDNCTFQYCKSLSSVTIPDSVTKIGTSAFQYCTSLSSITIGTGVTSIGTNAFYDCKSLTSITIPDSVASIGEQAFVDCTSLSSITLGSGITSVGNHAFVNCTSLISITIPNLDFALDLSYLNNEFDHDIIQTIVDGIKDGGSIIFSETSANYLKAEINTGEKAHWDGYTLKAGASSDYYYYNNDKA